MSRRVFISVAEASADQHAGNLVRELKKLDPDLIIEGIGGSEMAAAGAMIHFDTVQNAAMGFAAVYRVVEMWRIRKWMRTYFKSHRPDLLICIDSWTMNWNWAKLARGLGIPVMYYIAPQVWASRAGRVKKIRKYVDRVACILPFEQKFFEDHGVQATFVGHPLFDALPSHPDQKKSRRFPMAPPVIGIVPGSRAGVAKANFPNQLEVAEHILKEFPQATFLIPTMPATHEVVLNALAHRGGKAEQSTIGEDGLEHFGPFAVGLNQFNELVPRCDLSLVVSGTATLHAAGHGAPQIVVYRINPWIWNLFARWVVKTRTYSLVNLLSDSRTNIVPEYIPWYGSNAPVTEKAMEYLRNPALLAEQRDRMGRLIRAINRPGASRNAAELAVDLLLAREVTIKSQ